HISESLNFWFEKSEVPALEASAWKYPANTAASAYFKINDHLNCPGRNLDKEPAVFSAAADCLIGPALTPFLPQIRNGYPDRNNSDQNKFTCSPGLAGLRSITGCKS
ncbi:MAG: hypothetical protein LBK52_07255, partial [Deltaproteobacteria bacterium]|nr:hypothetical protein [Deltaproteobacteria bacterium]